LVNIFRLDVAGNYSSADARYVFDALKHVKSVHSIPEGAGAESMYVFDTLMVYGILEALHRQQRPGEAFFGDIALIDSSFSNFNGGSVPMSDGISFLISFRNQEMEGIGAHVNYGDILSHRLYGVLIYKFLKQL
jgi:hypothetical protein